MLSSHHFQYPWVLLHSLNPPYFINITTVILPPCLSPFQLTISIFIIFLTIITCLEPNICLQCSPCFCLMFKFTFPGFEAISLQFFCFSPNSAILTSPFSPQTILPLSFLRFFSWNSPIIFSKACICFWIYSFFLLLHSFQKRKYDSFPKINLSTLNSHHSIQPFKGT